MAVNPPLDDTHDGAHRSWVESANNPQADFPVQNLPFGVFGREEGDRRPAVGMAIGDQILDLRACGPSGLLEGLSDGTAQACAAASLNSLMALGAGHWRELRRRVSELLRADSADWRENREAVQPLLVPMDEAAMLLPAHIGDYTDFYASIHHATNVGRLFRPDNPLLPNYKYVPIGYHGRASSIVVSSSAVRRPCGQAKAADADAPRFGPSQWLDYEAEVGFFVGPGNGWGEPVPLAEAEQHLFGACLVNDWSARDIQAWEYQPLGPFLAKNFATTISPWVVTMDALAPFRVASFERPDADPAPLPYLSAPGDRAQGGIDLILTVEIRSRRMRAAGLPALGLSRARFRDLYWTAAQLLTHHASNGCNLCPGDLIASGTVSGPDREACGCLLELTRRGADPLQLPGGEVRRFLEDDDEITIRGHCRREGFARVGLGECRGTVAAAVELR